VTGFLVFVLKQREIEAGEVVSQVRDVGIEREREIDWKGWIVSFLKFLGENWVVVGGFVGSGRGGRICG